MWANFTAFSKNDRRLRSHSEERANRRSARTVQNASLFRIAPVRPTFFHSAATCLHVPARLTRQATKHEGRKPRPSERHVVGCCEKLGGKLSGLNLTILTSVLPSIIWERLFGEPKLVNLIATAHKVFVCISSRDAVVKLH